MEQEGAGQPRTRTPRMTATSGETDIETLPEPAGLHDPTSGRLSPAEPTRGVTG